MMQANRKIPRGWQAAIEAQTPFGIRAQQVLTRPMPTPYRLMNHTRYGNRLAEIIKRETGEVIKCNDCQSEIGRLNKMSAEGIRGDLHNIATAIVERGKSKAPELWQRLACQMSPLLVHRRVRGWIAEAIETIPTVDRSQWTCNVRHLTFHVWPTKRHDSWRWNLKQLAQRWQLFNGKKCIGIVADRQSETHQAVLDYCDSLGMHWDHIIRKTNSRSLREVYTWIPMLECLNPESASPDEVVFSCHGKGVRHDTREEPILRWATVMYESCLDDWPHVERQLMQYLATGSLKRYGTFAGGKNHRWDYSGTFFWWRLAEVGKRNWRDVDHRFFGTESWLGKQMHRDEAGCLFHDGTGDLYCSEQWNRTVWPLWLEYKKEMEARNAHRGV